MVDTIIGENSFSELRKYFSENNFSDIFILTDTNTSKCVPLLFEAVSILKDAHVITIDAGEKNKNYTSVEKIILKLIFHNADRNSLLINLGGGMITDVGGFTATVYKRGIKFINIPTSLMGMVDASIGSKTGINFSGLKNTIGTFYSPERIFINPIFLKTLPEREFKSALSEIVKHLLLSDHTLWNKFTNNSIHFFAQANLINLIKNSVQFKEAIVAEDLHERSRRHILNLGHTIGHAVESFYLNTENELLHGEAIAAGLIAELFLSTKIHSLNKTILTETVDILLNIFPELNVDCKMNDLLPFLISDKKNKNSTIGFSLLKAIGDPSEISYPKIDLISESIDFMVMKLKRKVTAINDIN